MIRVIREFGGYTFASLAAFALDFSLLAIQVDWLGVPYLVAAAISFLAGTILIYWAAIRHIFAYRRLDDARIEFTLFLALGIVGLSVNMGAMYLAVERLEVHYLVAKIIAAGCTFFVNFALRRWSLFSRWDRAGLKSQAREVVH